MATAYDTSLSLNAEENTDDIQLQQFQLAQNKKIQARFLTCANTLCFVILIANVVVIFLIGEEDTFSVYCVVGEALMWGTPALSCILLCGGYKSKLSTLTQVSVGILLAAHIGLSVIHVVTKWKIVWQFIFYCVLITFRLFLVLYLIWQTYQFGTVGRTVNFLEFRLEGYKRKHEQKSPEDSKIILPQKISNTEDVVLAYTYDPRSVRDRYLSPSESDSKLFA